MNTLNDLNAKVFVISLEGSKRRVHIINEFKKINLEFEFIDAVNGHSLKLESDPLVNYEMVLKHPKWLTPGAIGCGLSHVKCYQKVIDEKLDFALIFEDDISFNFDIIDIVKKCKEITSDDEVTLFFYLCWNEIILYKKDAINLSTDTSLFHTSGNLNLMSTGGY